ncbi:MAG: gamma-glutamyltransferase [Nitriliruptoraceae bacterium]|nr:gamma-glutamyltransferase [Nitriliruptoraceae bacterium]
MPLLPAGTVGAVAAGHPAVVEAAARLLIDGGNAYDAVVAAGFAAALAEPCLSSLAGGGFLLAAPDAAPARVFDFFVDTPGRGRPTDGAPPELTPVTLHFGGATQVFHVGLASVAVPGCLAGYLAVHRRLGRAPLAEVVAPAIELAREGVVLGPDQASVVRLLRPIFALGTRARAAFVPEDRPFADDDRVGNPALGSFLEAVATGEVTGFDHPDVATGIVEEMAVEGGLLTVEDLRSYRVIEREPLRVTGVGARTEATLITNPPPSFGGSLIGRGLQELGRDGPAGPVGSGPRLHQVATVLDQVTGWHRDPAAPPRSSRGTTHCSVVDAEGNLASMTTSNGSGSGRTLGATGALANNIMGETDLHPGGFHLAPPGQRVGSMMAPSVLRRRGAADVALGSGGSERIRSALIQTVTHLVDGGLDLSATVEATRLHVVDGVVQLEPGADRAAVAHLAARWEVNEWSVTDLYFGGVNAVTADGDHAADHRRGGRSTLVSIPGTT